MAIPFIVFLHIGQVLAQEESDPPPAGPKGESVKDDVTGPVEITVTVPVTESVVPTITPTVMQTVTESVSPTETPVPVIVITPTETVAPTPNLEPTATPDYGRDDYEVDSFEQPALWTGTMRRTFSPAGDQDFVLYFIKSGRTVIKTKDLTGAADTVIEVWHGDEFIATDDDSGEGLASYVVVQSDREMEVVIIVRNKAVGYGPTVGYTLEIVPEAEFTPTPTQPATSTPVPVQPTQTPFVVTATPAPTNTPEPTSTPRPPVPQGPLPTPTPSMEFVLRVDVFIDADRDGELDSGEGINGIFIEARTLDTTVSFTGYSQNGIAVIEVICPPGSHSPFNQLEVVVPYLQESKFLNINLNQTEGSQTLITNFALDAPVLPIALP